MNAVLLRELEELRRAPLQRLRGKYRELFGEQPRSRHKQQLFRCLAWRMQALAEGELSDRARSRAQEIAQDADLRTLAPRQWPGALALQSEASARVRHDRRIPAAGTQLSREYRGKPVLVTVRQTGFEYQGRSYRSLSAIAGEVTGTRWNGLAFFGLTGARTNRKGLAHAGKS